MDWTTFEVDNYFILDLIYLIMSQLNLSIIYELVDYPAKCGAIGFKDFLDILWKYEGETFLFGLNFLGGEGAKLRNFKAKRLLVGENSVKNLLFPREETCF